MTDLHVLDGSRRFLYVVKHEIKQFKHTQCILHVHRLYNTSTDNVHEIASSDQEDCCNHIPS